MSGINEILVLNTSVISIMIASLTEATRRKINSMNTDLSQEMITNLEALKKLINVVAELRGPNGCPWDKAQTDRSLAPYIIEEAHELAHAIEHGSDSDIIEELGDSLFQVILQAQVAKDEGRFQLSDIVHSISEKLIRRHPHVFQSDFSEGKDLSSIWQNWERTKRSEKPKNKKNFDFPHHLPALQTSGKIGRKCQTYKFDWSEPAQVFLKIQEEIEELNIELNKKVQSSKSLEHEIGDVLFSVAQLARHLELEPEQCLRETNQRFIQRFESMLAISNLNVLEFSELPDAEKENLWQQAKKLETENEKA